MTPQEILNKAAKHLLTQGSKSTCSEGYCAYRGEMGKMCAVGPFIPDELYKESLEGKPVDSNEVALVLAKAGVLGQNVQLNNLNDSVQFRLLCGIQSIHDLHGANTWQERLKTLAVGFNLQPYEHVN